MILQPEPGSRLVKRKTLAPLARHWSACETCLCASFSAFTTVAAMPAFLKAAVKVGPSRVSQRSDDRVSGGSTQAGVVAVRPVLLANAAVTATLTAASTTTDTTITFFTMVLLLSVPLVTAWASLQPPQTAFNPATLRVHYASKSAAAPKRVRAYGLT